MPAFWKRKPSGLIHDNHRARATEITLRESIFPLSLVTALFFLWGFSYGLLNTLNKHLQDTIGITRSQSAALQACYFGYVCSEPTTTPCPPWSLSLTFIYTPVHIPLPR